MGQGRGISAIILVFCMFLFYSEMVHASNYVVGGRTGWTFNVSGWSGRHYKVGDTLIFYYNASNHNVVSVDEGGYNSCIASSGSKTYNSGRDFITLGQGTSYFICSFPSHCQTGGMKITAIAS